MEQIYYSRRIKGVSIPGIIHNGNYFHAKLSVYEDSDYVRIIYHPERKREV